MLSRRKLFGLIVLAPLAVPLAALASPQRPALAVNRMPMFTANLRDAQHELNYRMSRHVEYVARPEAIWNS